MSIVTSEHKTKKEAPIEGQSDLTLEGTFSASAVCSAFTLASVETGVCCCCLVVSDKWALFRFKRLLLGLLRGTCVEHEKLVAVASHELHSVYSPFCRFHLRPLEVFEVRWLLLVFPHVEFAAHEAALFDFWWHIPYVEEETCSSWCKY